MNSKEYGVICAVRCGAWCGVVMVKNSNVVGAVCGGVRGMG